MKLGYKIAVRFLKSNKVQTFFIILGIAIGVSVQIFIGLLIQGLQKSLIQKTIGNTSQITITTKDNTDEISDYAQILKDINSLGSKIKDVSIVTDHSALMKYGDNSKSLLVRGFNLEQADKIYNFTENLEGNLPQNKQEIILGIDLKNDYSISLQDQVDLITTSGETVSCTVVGFFDLKVASLNQNWGITSLDTAQEIFKTGDTITSIEIQVKDDEVFMADDTAKELAKGIENNGGDKSITVQNWKEQNEQLLSGLQGQSISSIMIQVFVLISVVLGIASVLAITVMQKSRQIGILKAMGIKSSATSYIFLFEGLILGFFGALLGILFGLGLSVAFTKFALNPDGTPVIALYINYSFIAFSGLIAILASIVAALIPAIKSLKLNPIDIIRNN